MMDEERSNVETFCSMMLASWDRNPCNRLKYYCSRDGDKVMKPKKNLDIRIRGEATRMAADVPASKASLWVRHL